MHYKNKLIEVKKPIEVLSIKKTTVLVNIPRK